ncbi:alpha/beta fold hydrolase [Lysobacter sp. 5GHs7-4]|uniref:esterase/lipase family protein n=1 Tax=Lysobacter sp. 5GHs7-4 TaxID=2904253 RepID=UPI001E5B01BD|nr:alpha/beta fold hydrolase [Lysobacter sp. 5GHs7-4]UHQ23817.1 alpha/beta fold hydrolase [Lysobacter sp. 5GHs7-4]
MDSQWIKPKLDAAAPTVVYVHGIMSDGASAWKNKKTGAYWPRLAANELSDAGVYVFSYHSRAFSGRFHVTDAADALWDELKRHGILQSRIVVFVCHSMGGIVARRLLVQRQSELAEHGTVIGLFLVASPSAGSQWANFFYPVINLFKHAQAQILKAGEDNQWLTTLGTDFRNLIAKPKPMIRGKELIEERIAYVWFLPWIRPIVSRDEGDRYFPDARVIQRSNHGSIAKPANAQAQQHLLLTEFANELVRISFSVTLGLPAGMSFRQAIGSLAAVETCTAQYRGLSEAQLKTPLPQEAQVNGPDTAAVAERIVAAYFGGEAAQFNVTVKDRVITVETTP